MRCDIKRALWLLPRYFHLNGPWTRNGKYMLCGFQKLPWRVEKAVTTLVRKAIEIQFPNKVHYVDVSGAEVWTIQQKLVAKHMRYFTRTEAWPWQRWAKDRLPIFVRYKNRTIIWNGTHRSTLGMLTGRRIRGRVIDLNAMCKWTKANPGKDFLKVKKGKRRGS